MNKLRITLWLDTGTASNGYSLKIAFLCSKSLIPGPRDARKNKTHLPAAYASAGGEVPDPNKPAMARGEEEAGVGGQRQRGDGLRVAVDGLPYRGGVRRGYQTHLPAACASKEWLGLGAAFALALAGGGAPDRERPARVELLQGPVAAVVLLKCLRRSHR